jgi:hypothetical protein
MGDTLKGYGLEDSKLKQIIAQFEKNLAEYERLHERRTNAFTYAWLSILLASILFVLWALYSHLF